MSSLNCFFCIAMTQFNKICPPYFPPSLRQRSGTLTFRMELTSPYTRNITILATTPPVYRIGIEVFVPPEVSIEQKSQHWFHVKWLNSIKKQKGQRIGLQHPDTDGNTRLTLMFTLRMWLSLYSPGLFWSSCFGFWISYFALDGILGLFTCLGCDHCTNCCK